MSELVVAATRGPLMESSHVVSAVVVDAAGQVLAAAGDPSVVTFWRSAAKPFQLYSLVADGGADHFGLTPDLLALACGSHNAESIHREVGARWLQAINITEADLACGGHPSLWPALADAMVHDETVATPLWSNCSGKHAGLLALARLHQWGLSGYEERPHPVQARVAAAIAEWTGVPVDGLAWGVDGCTAAAVALPLDAMARAYVRLATSTDPSARRIREAMMANPYLVAGADRLDTALMNAWAGRVLSKIGAEGVYSAALPTLGIGVSLKVHDGDMRSANLALVSVLEAIVARFASDDPWPLDALTEWRTPAIRNTRGTVTGHYEVRGGLHWK
ncbi:MAG TPA: asparaginase [Gemmatimonadales bacterium]|jgi:L-asparaginase II